MSSDLGKNPDHNFHAFSAAVLSVPTVYSEGSQLLHCKPLEAARLSNFGCKYLHTHRAVRDVPHRLSLL